MYVDGLEKKILDALERRPAQGVNELATAIMENARRVFEYCEALCLEGVLSKSKRHGIDVYSLASDEAGVVPEDLPVTTPVVKKPPLEQPPVSVVQPDPIAATPAAGEPTTTRKYRGVSWIADSKRWRASWTEDGRQRSVARWHLHEEREAALFHDQQQLRLNHPERCNFGADAVEEEVKMVEMLKEEEPEAVPDLGREPVIMPVEHLAAPPKPALRELLPEAPVALNTVPDKRPFVLEIAKLVTYSPMEAMRQEMIIDRMMRAGLAKAKSAGYDEAAVIFLNDDGGVVAGSRQEFRL
jgi:hypothetical protein